MAESQNAKQRLKAVAQFFWRCLPEKPRRWMYWSFMSSNNKMIRFFFVIFLVHHRANIRKVWPHVHGLDHLVLALWGVLLGFHEPLLDLAWRRAPRLRQRRGIRAEDDAGRKILHVTSSFDLGGTQTQIKGLCTYSPSGFDHQAIEIFPEFNYLYRRGETVDESLYTGPSRWGRTAGRLVAHPSYRSSQLVQIYKLVRDFRRERPRVVVGWGHEMCATTFAAAAIARVPHVVFCIRTVNPRDYTWMPHTIQEQLHRAHRSMSPMVSAITVNSTLLRGDHAGWLDLDPALINVCANGIQIPPIAPEERRQARIRVRQQLGIPADATVIVNVGRFSSEKGQHSMVEANRLLQLRGTPGSFIWLMCGDGSTLDDVRSVAEGFGMTNMLFPGRTDAVRDMLCASDIFVMPSDFEGMPNAMMEAMALGLPCISTNRSGALDVARPGIEALYYNPRDAVTLAQHVLSLLEDPARARALGAAAGERIKEFSVARFVGCFEQVLTRALTATESAAVPQRQPADAKQETWAG
jgi:glycosyltransferase involved in cell wall biosynthesis